MKVLKEVLDSVKPTAAEEKDISYKINKFLSKIKVKDAKVILGGSGAKGTWLKTAHDADIFVLFDYKKFKDKSAELSDILGKELKKKFKGIRRLHGSRDYFQVRQKGFTFEIVPILNIKKAKDALNITDVSPLHSGWVVRNATKKLRDEIRLAKLFCKANNVYGAESYIKGFSGYVLEVLTVRYGSFMKLVRAAASWKDKEIIDVEKYYKNKNQVMYDLNKAKTYSPLILIDPVQEDRNAAAALSVEKFEKFKGICKKFVKNPKKEFFVLKKIEIDDLKKKERKRKLIALDVTALSGKEDVVGSKMLKVLEFLAKGLQEYGFNVKEYSWQWNRVGKALFWLYVDKKDLNGYVVRNGPPVAIKVHAAKFRKMHKNTFVKKGKLFAKDKRKFVNAEKYVKFLIKEAYVKERVKGITFSS